MKDTILDNVIKYNNILILFLTTLEESNLEINIVSENTNTSDKKPYVATNILIICFLLPCFKFE